MLRKDIIFYWFMDLTLVIREHFYMVIMMEPFQLPKLADAFLKNDMYDR